MSRHGASTVRRRAGVLTHCLPKPLGEPAIQQQIACANLLNTASVVMTGRFSTACSSPKVGLGSKMGLDATNKWLGETGREWGRPITMDDAVKRRVDALWDETGFSGRKRS